MTATHSEPRTQVRGVTTRAATVTERLHREPLGAAVIDDMPSMPIDTMPYADTKKLAEAHGARPNCRQMEPLVMFAVYIPESLPASPKTTSAHIY